MKNVGEYDIEDIEQKITYLLEHRKNKKLAIGVNFTAETDNDFGRDDFLE